ncbi:hypothetical protein [Proteiniphilum sp.]|uniref:hypothetical protein n=1 Tax=Proteiniphilum sp. TaxID=1926877 RepID=UPI002B208281|nr:hypothetical protein [Proteiniphilum sp.]MEA4918132.1 hypothetical protein [Proteiniphilum sp.]
MTLKQAQQKWDDAIQMKVEHAPNSVTEENLRKWAERSSPEPAKVLFIKIGKKTSQIIYSRSAKIEELRQLSMVPGTKVKMTGAEAEMENSHDKIFTVTHGPARMCGDLVVWLDGYSGAYACEYLEIIN